MYVTSSQFRRARFPAGQRMLSIVFVWPRGRRGWLTALVRFSEAPWCLLVVVALGSELNSASRQDGVLMSHLDVTDVVVSNVMRIPEICVAMRHAKLMTRKGAVASGAPSPRTAVMHYCLSQVCHRRCCHS